MLSVAAAFARHPQEQLSRLPVAAVAAVPRGCPSRLEQLSRLSRLQGPRGLQGFQIQPLHPCQSAQERLSAALFQKASVGASNLGRGFSQL